MDIRKVKKLIELLEESGIAEIESRRYDVVTDAVFIEKESPVRVKAVEGVRIIVTLIERT